ncbi:MAG: PD-(D/E)XK nuclease family protein [Lentimicrobium sp.]
MENTHQRLDLENLLSKVRLIVKKYEEIAEKTGENFNVFKILKLSTNEVRTHSAFLAELLDPNGSHGMKEIFLTKFLLQQREKFHGNENFLKMFENFEPKFARVSTEEYIGIINMVNLEGGRIDLVIKDHAGRVILFENKIYAGDEKLQLMRYRSAYKSAPIFYLTLDGKEPSKDSISTNLKNRPDLSNLEEGKDFFRISYKDDIIEWLTSCLKEAVVFPLLRETLLQYINLIKHLTGITMDNNLKNEIAELIANSSENIKAADVISSNVTDAKILLQLEFWDNLNIELLKKVSFHDKLHKTYNNDNIRIFYKSRGKDSSYGLNVTGPICKLPNGIDVSFEITIDGDLIPFYGFNFTIGNEKITVEKHPGSIDDEVKILKHADNAIFQKYNWYYTYLQPHFNFLSAPFSEYSKIISKDSDNIIVEYVRRIVFTLTEFKNSVSEIPDKDAIFLYDIIE